MQRISKHFGRRKVKRKATPWTKVPVPDDEDDEEARWPWPDMARHGQTWPDLVVLGSGVGVFRGCGQVEEPLEEPVDDMKTASDALMELTTARVPKEWADFESASFMMCAKVKWT